MPQIVIARLDRTIQYSSDTCSRTEKPPRTGSPAFAGDDSWSRLPRRLERICARHRPGVAEARVVGAVEQFARAQRRIELCKREHFGGRRALRKMDRAQVARMF